MLNFVIDKKNYRVMKSTLQIQMKSAENNQLQKKAIIQLPPWAQLQQFHIIHKYLQLVSETSQLSSGQKQSSIKHFFINQINNNKQIFISKRLIHLMRISDYLTLQSFQHYFINYSIISSLSLDNCIVYLEQTHKKLKNTSSGSSQSWYNLLNTCIDFIAKNLVHLYQLQFQRIQMLHEKILAEILDRAVKLLINQNITHLTVQEIQKQRQIIFNLLLKSKKVNSVDALCTILKTNLLNKKINKKMHAKLSWKLHDFNQIIDQKIKNFKFLDLHWTLKAVRIPNKGLQIKLCLLPTPSQQIKRIILEQIGIFYSKLFWSIQPYAQSTVQGQDPLSLHFICLKNPQPINIFQISTTFQQSLLNKKLELSIYCSIDHCYSFVINYLIQQYSRLRVDQRRLDKDEVYALVEGSKTAKKYSQAVWLIKYLKTNNIQIPNYLLINLPFDKLPIYQAQFLKKLNSVDNKSPYKAMIKKQTKQKLSETDNDANSLSTSKISQRQQYETRSNASRNPSKSRHRKIFENSPHKTQNHPQKSFVSVKNVEQQRQMEQILKIIDLKNYFHDKNSPYLNFL